jgi:hypothetical protein
VIILCVFQLLVSCLVARHKQPLDFQNNRFAPMIYKGSDVILGLLPDQIVSKISEQQQKFSTDGVTAGNAVAGAVNMATMAANTMNNVVGAASNGMVNGMNLPTPGQIANNLHKPNTAQQEAENLARLQPKAAVPAEGSNITAKQQNDLNRFLNLQDVDEEGALEAEAQEAPAASAMISPPVGSAVAPMPAPMAQAPAMMPPPVAQQAPRAPVMQQPIQPSIQPQNAPQRTR